MLVLARKKDEAVVISVAGREVRLIVADISRGVVRLGFEAPHDVRIVREELLKETPNE